MKTKIALLCALALSLVLLAGCRQPRAFSEAAISQDYDWEMVKESGYGPPSSIMVDVLKGKDIRIRIEAFNGILVNNVFIIKLILFPSGSQTGYSFDPSLASVRLANGRLVRAKGLRCAYTMHNLNYLRSATPVVGSIPIQKYECFKLFFDTVPPSVEENFGLFINGLTRDGRPVSVPYVQFSKAMR